MVRPVLFLAYSGEMRWRTRAGDEVAARLGEDVGPDATAQALRTALDPKGEWIASVLAAADRRLDEVRRTVPDAGGLVIATDHEHARALRPAARSDLRREGADGALRRSQGEQRDREVRCVVGTMAGRGADGQRGCRHPAARRRRLRHDHDDAAVLRAGCRALRPCKAARRDRVDLPPQRPHAAAARIPRWRRSETTSSAGWSATTTTSLLLSVTCWRAAEADQSEAGLADGTFEALESAARFDRVVFDGGEFGHMTEAGSQEEHDYLGLPGLLEPDQVAVLLKERQSQQAKHGSRRPSPPRRLTSGQWPTCAAS